MPFRIDNSLEENGYYDTNKLEWIYPPFYHYFWYGTEFSDQIITGTYHFAFTDKNGEISNGNFTINQIVNLQNIPSDSYSYYLDQDGNFIWHWQVPNIDPKIQSSVRAQVRVYDEREKYMGEIFVWVPTNMGWVFIPRNIFDQALSMGTTLKLVTQTRTNDNNNRSYSNEVPLSNLVPQPTGCIATLDETLSLHIPVLSYLIPYWGAPSYWADLVYEYNPAYPALILFKLSNAGVISDPTFSCSASTLSDDLKIHIPDILLPDGIAHIWVDLEYSPALSTDENAYFLVTNYGVVSN